MSDEEKIELDPIFAGILNSWFKATAGGNEE